jgi:hypothetical protein
VLYFLARPPIRAFCLEEARQRAALTLFRAREVVLSRNEVERLACGSMNEYARAKFAWWTILEPS